MEQAETKAKEDLQGWKKDIQFDLNQHKLKNSIKMIRIKLISLEDQCDTYCTANNLRKIR